jgi:hypothetical protein
MTTLTKILVATLLSLLTFSCNFDFNIVGVNGDGNVVTSERELKGSFNQIDASRGLDVVLTQGTYEQVSVEADENLQEIIVTEIEGNTLKITATENIASSTSKTVYVSFVDLIGIDASSGSRVSSKNTITAEDFDIESSSGSDLNLSLQAEHLDCDSSSGSNLKLSGKATSVIARASSGSGISAADLATESANVKATSGANISINTSKKLTASANSGGNISYYGNPEVVNNNESVSGSIHSRQ